MCSLYPPMVCSRLPTQGIPICTNVCIYVCIYIYTYIEPLVLPLKQHVCETLQDNDFVEIFAGEGHVSSALRKEARLHINVCLRIKYVSLI